MRPFLFADNQFPDRPEAVRPGEPERALTTVGIFLFWPLVGREVEVETIKRKRNPEDHSSEICMELDQLIALGELLRKLDTPAETRDEFYPGLADMIAGCADRIKGMLNPTYDYMLEGGITGDLERRKRPTAAQEGGAA